MCRLDENIKKKVRADLSAYTFILKIQENSSAKKNNETQKVEKYNEQKKISKDRILFRNIK